MDISTHDDLDNYCRMLGHDVPFKYCRSVGGDVPCRRIADCWFTRFDVVAWLHEHYTQAQLDQLTAPPQPKIASLLELIERAKSARDENRGA